MNCPPEIADIITRLIEAGILRIRAAAWAGDSARCAAEADHIHNLPGLLTNFSSETLRYYWDVERPAFLAQSGEVSLVTFHHLWQELAGWVTGRSLPTRATSAG